MNAAQDLAKQLVAELDRQQEREREERAEEVPVAHLRRAAEALLDTIERRGLAGASALELAEAFPGFLVEAALKRVTGDTPQARLARAFELLGERTTVRQRNQSPVWNRLRAKLEKLKTFARGIRPSRRARAELGSNAGMRSAA